MKTFVIVEPNKEVCQYMYQILTGFLKGRAKVVDFQSFDEALKKLPLIDVIDDLAMVFVAFEAPTGRGALVACQLKEHLPQAKIILTSTIDALEVAEHYDLDDFVFKIDFAKVGKIGELLQKHGIVL